MCIHYVFIANLFIGYSSTWNTGNSREPSRIQYCKNEPLHAYAFSLYGEIPRSNAVGCYLIFTRGCTLMGMHTGQPITWPCLHTIDSRIRYRCLIVQPPPHVACFGISSDHFRTGHRHGNSSCQVCCRRMICGCV